MGQQHSTSPDLLAGLASSFKGEKSNTAHISNTGFQFEERGPVLAQTRGHTDICKDSTHISQHIQESLQHRTNAVVTKTWDCSGGFVHSILKNAGNHPALHIPCGIWLGGLSCAGYWRQPNTPGFRVPSPPRRQDTALQNKHPCTEARLFAWCSKLILLTESLPASRHHTCFRCWSGGEGCRQKLKDKQN